MMISSLQIISYHPFISAQTVILNDLRININPLEPNGYYMYHLLYHTKTRHSAHTLHLCVPYESHNKQRLFPQTALTG
jgi:hypothetical protein